MTSTMKEKNLKCNTCLKCRNRNQKQPLVRHEIPDLPLQNIGSDTFEYELKIYLLVIDYYSKFLETCRMRDKHASSVISALKFIFVPSKTWHPTYVYGSQCTIQVSRI